MWSLREYQVFLFLFNVIFYFCLVQHGSAIIDFKGAGPYFAEITSVENKAVRKESPVKFRAFLTPAGGGVFERYMHSWMNVTRPISGVSGEVTIEHKVGRPSIYKPFALDGARTGNVCADKQFQVFMRYYEPKYYSNATSCQWKTGYTEYKCPLSLNKVLKEDMSMSSSVYGEFRMNFTLREGKETIVDYSMEIAFMKLSTYENQLKAKKEKYEARKKTGHGQNDEVASLMKQCPSLFK